MNGLALLPAAADEVRRLDDGGRRRAFGVLLALSRGHLRGEPLLGREEGLLHKLVVWNLAVIYLELPDSSIFVTEVCLVGVRDLSDRIAKVVSTLEAMPAAQRIPHAARTLELVRESPYPAHQHVDLTALERLVSTA